MTDTDMEKARSVLARLNARRAELAEHEGRTLSDLAISSIRNDLRKLLAQARLDMGEIGIQLPDANPIASISGMVSDVAAAASAIEQALGATT